MVLNGQLSSSPFEIFNLKNPGPQLKPATVTLCCQWLFMWVLSPDSHGSSFHELLYGAIPPSLWLCLNNWLCILSAPVVARNFAASQDCAMALVPILQESPKSLQLRGNPKPLGDANYDSGVTRYRDKGPFETVLLNSLPPSPLPLRTS